MMAKSRQAELKAAIGERLFRTPEATNFALREVERIDFYPPPIAQDMMRRVRDYRDRTALTRIFDAITAVKISPEEALEDCGQFGLHRLQYEDASFSFVVVPDHPGGSRSSRPSDSPDPALEAKKSLPRAQRSISARLRDR